MKNNVSSPSDCEAWDTWANMALSNAFTVDLEEWFHGLTSTNPQVARWPNFESRVVPATQQLLTMLTRYNVKATFFTLGHVAEKHPALVEQIADAGHEIAVHGYYHRFVYKLSPGEFAREIEQSLEIIQKRVGKQPIGHRAPYFSINASATWAFDILRSFGFRYDSSIFPTRNPLYGYPDAPPLPHHLQNDLWEYPPSTLQLAGLRLPVSGGFYFRALPYTVVRQALRRLNAQDHPAIFYIHPWELDTGQRHNRVTPRERLTHYYGRGRLASKLDRLLTDFTFAPLGNLWALNVAERQHDSVVTTAPIVAR